jgi:hypothetical protein
MEEFKFSKNVLSFGADALEWIINMKIFRRKDIYLRLRNFWDSLWLSE